LNEENRLMSESGNFTATKKRKTFTHTKCFDIIGVYDAFDRNNLFFM